MLTTNPDFSGPNLGGRIKRNKKEHLSPLAVPRAALPKALLLGPPSPDCGLVGLAASVRCPLTLVAQLLSGRQGQSGGPLHYWMDLLSVLCGVVPADPEV